MTNESVADTLVREAISKTVYWVNGIMLSWVRWPTSYVNNVWELFATLKTAPG